MLFDHTSCSPHRPEQIVSLDSNVRFEETAVVEARVHGVDYRLNFAGLFARSTLADKVRQTDKYTGCIITVLAYF